MNVRISKTKYLNGLQCKKLLWYIYNEPEAIPEPDEATQAIFGLFILYSIATCLLKSSGMGFFL
ncbi:MAG: hypothetical protein WC437_05415 [Patescibacteria group bacterium]